MIGSPLVYRLAHSTGSVELALTPERLVVNTQGTGLADRPRSAEIPLASLRQFAVTPTTTAQNTQGTRALRVVDTSRNAELLFSYDLGGRLEKRRVFVNASDPTFQSLLNQLAQLRPDASLLHLAPAEAYARIGVVSPQSAVLVIIALLVIVPIIIVIIAVAISVLL